uniref:Zgc:171482 n=1 Tax=Hucho hucho TaxID=62062 RepID=A0A4W5RHS9_9TELE
MSLTPVGFDSLHVSQHGPMFGEMKSAGVVEGGLFTESYCNICNAQLISESQRTAHYESKKHANKVRLFYMLHPEDGGPPSKRLRPDNPVCVHTKLHTHTHQITCTYTLNHTHTPNHTHTHRLCSAMASPAMACGRQIESLAAVLQSEGTGQHKQRQADRKTPTQTHTHKHISG